VGALSRAIFACGAFSARGQARLRVRDDRAYAAVIQMPCEQQLGIAMTQGLGGKWQRGMWHIPADDQLKACNVMLNFCRGHVVRGLKQVALFRIGQPRVRPGVAVSKEVNELRTLLAVGLTATDGCGNVLRSDPESSSTT